MAPNGSGLQMLKWEFRERERESSLSLTPSVGRWREKGLKLESMGQEYCNAPLSGVHSGLNPIDWKRLLFI